MDETFLGGMTSEGTRKASFMMTTKNQSSIIREMTEKRRSNNRGTKCAMEELELKMLLDIPDIKLSYEFGLMCICIGWLDFWYTILSIRDWSAGWYDHCSDHSSQR